MELIIKQHGKTLHNQAIPVEMKKRITLNVMSAFDKKFSSTTSKDRATHLFNSLNS